MQICPLVIRNTVTVFFSHPTFFFIDFSGSVLLMFVNLQGSKWCHLKYILTVFSQNKLYVYEDY